MSPSPPASILAAWRLADRPCETVSGGHINLTFRVRDISGDLCLQRLNPIFDPKLHEDLQAITDHLHRKGLATPRLQPSTEGRLWEKDEQGGVWRVMDWMEGEILLATDGPERCREAGRLLGTFHAALWDLDHPFRARRLGVHDTAAHLTKLEQAMRQDDATNELKALGRIILETAQDLDLPMQLPERIVHGDPKISNLLFWPDGRAHCWVDLDTLAPMPLAIELGDAMRSWCSPGGEETEAHFDSDFFQSAMEGWLEVMADLPSTEEKQAILPWCVGIALELSARFCADAYHESYFGWDPTRYASAAEHNLLRARSQLTLARSILAQREDLRAILDKLGIA